MAGPSGWIEQLRNKLPAGFPIAIDEANICYQNNLSYDGLNQNGANGFIAGQFWAEMMGIGMEEGLNFLNFWSVIEGAGSNNFDNIGYINATSGNASLADGDRKSTYWHFKMMADYMSSGVFYPGNSFSLDNTSPVSDIKAYATFTGSSGTIMVMNQTSSDHTCRIWLENVDTHVPDIGVTFDAGINKYLPLIYLPKNSTEWILLNECNEMTARYVYTQGIYQIWPGTAPGQVSYLNGCPVHNGCPDLERVYNDSTISTHEIKADKAMIKGTLTIPNGDTLTLDNAEIIMDADSKINVAAGGKLIIRDSKIHSCEGNIWRGIYLKGQASVQQQLQIDRSNLSDADTLIFADSTRNIRIEDSYFSHSANCIFLNHNTAFKINRNLFENIAYPVYTLNNLTALGSTVVDTVSEITENNFEIPITGIQMDSSNHSYLNISCNLFNNYQAYGIYATNSVLKDQGTSAIGAGNQFVSASFINDSVSAFYHDGDTINYYYSSSEPLTLDLKKTYILTYEATDSAECSVPKTGCPNAFAGENVIIGRGCTTILKADPIEEDALYSWRNLATNEVFSADTQVTVSPLVKTTYELKIQFPNGCISYGQTTVYVSLATTCISYDCPDSFPAENVWDDRQIGDLHLSSDTIEVTGKVTVQTGGILTIDSCEIIFTNGGSIEVRPTSKLIIRDSKLHSCDKYSWGGITVHGDTSKTTPLDIQRSYIADSPYLITADNAKSISITDSYFRKAYTAIVLEANEGFTITGNVFDSMSYAVATRDCYDLPSTIRDNYFDYSDTSVYFYKDDHSDLTINCNTFNHYLSYGVYSTSSLLQDQGDTLTGAGNVFVPNNDTLDERAFTHDGNTINYYASPSQPLAFSLSATHIITDTARDEASCVYLRPSANSFLPEAMQPNSFVLYPNPATSSVTLKYAIDSQKSVYWKLCNLMGQEIRLMAIDSKGNSVSLDLSQLQPGIYLSIIEENGAKLNVSKLVINK
jgi:hypothetical protein